MNVLTPLGKYLRKMRIDRSERLIDAANEFGVSVAMLSAVERGQKSVSKDLINAICRHYDLSGADAQEVEQLAKESARQVKIGLSGASDPARELAVAFARRFETLGESEIGQMLSVLRAKKKEDD